MFSGQSVFIVYFIFISHFESSSALTEAEKTQLQLEREEAARIWAPVVYFHSDENIFPTDVHTFLQNVQIKKKTEDEREDTTSVSPISRSLNVQPLPEGEASKHTYLVAPIDPECVNCPLPHYLLGEKPNNNYSPPTYAVISSCLPEEKYNDNNAIYRRMGRNFRRPRLARRITDTIMRASRHIRDKYWKGRASRSHKPVSESRSSKTITVTIEGLLNNVPKPSKTLLPPSQLINIERLKKQLEAVQRSVKNSSEEEHSNYAYILKSSVVSKITPNHTNSIRDSTTSSSKVYKVFKNCGENQTKCIDTETKLNSQLDDTTKTSAVKKSIIQLRESESLSGEDKHNTIDGSSFEDTTNEPVHYSTTELPHQDVSKWLKPRKGHHFTITYWMFYPYSRGKPVCTSKLWLLGRVFKPRLRNKCYGEEVTLNDHVGDWEHMSIFFEDGVPQRMYVSSHFYGAFYQYIPSKHIFEYRGKDARHPLPVSADFPATIKLKGTHPVVFSALGSHGLWGGAGVHRYMNFIPLEDVTETGTQWKTWKNIDVIDYRDANHDQEDRQWLRFEGRWGNPSHECYKGLFGICTLSKGPTGIPNKRVNFPCDQPSHSTFFPDNG